MFTRIVKLTFESKDIELFLSNFKESKNDIRNFPGCNHLKLLRDKANPSIFFTYSNWESEEALDNYRNSDLFKSIWTKTKPMFSDKPEAWSVDVLAELL
jgi:quinol monooxygenase YgiN